MQVHVLMVDRETPPVAVVTDIEVADHWVELGFGAITLEVDDYTLVNVVLDDLGELG